MSFPYLTLIAGLLVLYQAFKRIRTADEYIAKLQKAITQAHLYPRLASEKDYLRTQYFLFIIGSLLTLVSLGLIFLK